MQPSDQAYPVRLFIRHKARLKLSAYLQSTGEPDAAIDDKLLSDVVKTLLQPSTNAAAFKPCSSRDQALQIEEQIAEDIAAAYLRIKQQQTDPVVQQLNRLL